RIVSETPDTPTARAAVRLLGRMVQQGKNRAAQAYLETLTSLPGGIAREARLMLLPGYASLGEYAAAHVLANQVIAAEKEDEALALVGQMALFLLYMDQQQYGEARVVLASMQPVAEEGQTWLAIAREVFRRESGDDEAIAPIPPSLPEGSFPATSS